jgi:carboxylate-amine ligase
MPLKEPSWTVGIEEEYLLVDRVSRDLIRERPEDLMAELEELLQGQVVPEFLNSQVEIGTRVGATVMEAGDDLKRLRATVASAAEKHGLAIIAASTHPFASWGEQTHTDKERYNVLAHDMQAVAMRLLICGMHVHVGIEDPDLRIDLLSQVAYFLPHLLVLSTSSPFWSGKDTGLRSYRISVFDELPRTGVPETFDSWGEYERHVDMLVNAGLIEDASKLWWDIRPSCKFPTLEMRLCDIPTRVNDTICIAAFYACLLRMLYRLRRSNQRWRRYRGMLVSENRWRAQRYGIDEGLVDFGRGEIVPYEELLEELIEAVAPDAAALGCRREILHAREILQRGTSAHRQLAAWRAAVDSGATGTAAFIPVVDMLIEETVADL